MRVVRLVAVLALAVSACGGGDDERGSDPSASAPADATPEATPPTDAPVPPEPTAQPSTAPTSTGPPVDSTGDHLPASWLRYGADGLVRVTASGEELLVDRPIASAASDGAGGVLYVERDPDEFGPTWWLGADSTEPVVVGDYTDAVFAARVDGEPAVVGYFPTDECVEDSVVPMVAHILPSGEFRTLQCGVGGQDVGREPNSYGGGLYVGVEWQAPHPVAMGSDIRLVFRDAAGAIVDVPTNPYADDSSPCELRAALSPDGSRVAVVHWPAAPPIGTDDYGAWRESMSDLDADLSVVDLATGEVLFADAIAADARPPRGSWFDGRYVVIDPSGASSWSGEDGGGDAAYTVIDTHTGTVTELAGRIALEVALTDGPPPGVEPTTLPPGPTEVLRAEGLGPFDMGSPADDVEAWLTAQFGEPTVAVVEAGEGGWPMPSCADRRFSYRADAQLTIGHTDLIGDGCSPTPELAGWFVDADDVPWFAREHGHETTPPNVWRLTTVDGIGLASTAAELRRAHPDTTFGEWDLDEYVPASFDTGTGLLGRVDWNAVADAQRALNARGADLAEDGMFGPRTQAAVAEFQTTNAIVEDRLGPLTLAALDVRVPDDAPIVYLTAGQWAWGY